MSSTDRSCVCSWPKCREWSALLAGIPEHSCLSKLVRIRYSNITSLQKSLLVETSSKKRESIEAKIANHLKYRKVVLHHLKSPQAKELEGKDIAIARFHFPHEYIRSQIGRLSWPVSHSAAVKYGLGVLPMDKINVASKLSKTYYVAPIVTRAYMELFIQELQPSLRIDHSNTYPSRSSRISIRQQKIDEASPKSDNDTDLTNDTYLQTAQATPAPSTHDSTEMSGIVDFHHYLLPVDILKSRVEMIIQPLLGFGKEQNSIFRKGDHLNNLAMDNEHYVNISIMLGKMHKCSQPITLATCPTTHLNFCSEEMCSNTILSYRMAKGSPMVCRACHRYISVKIRKRKRQNYSAVDGTEIHSKVNITLLSPSSRAKRLKTASVHRKILKKKLEDALNSSEKIELSASNTGDAAIINFLAKAGSIAQDDKDKYRNELIEGLSSELLGSSDRSKDIKENKKIEEISEFVDETIQRICNYQSVLDGKPKSVRFSPREIRMALTMYSVSSSGYRELRSSSLQVMPSVRQIKRWRSKSKLKDGENPKVYGALNDMFLSERLGSQQAPLYVTLMVDEMKLKNGIYVNAMTNEVIGFVSDDNNFRSVHDDVMGMINDIDQYQSNNDDAEEADGVEMASYVNQFRIRTARNVTANVEFFFNNGSLPGDELLSQLLHVTSQLNNVNIQVLMLCMDAGGNNSRLANLLRHEKNLNDVPWLEEDCISYCDPTSTGNHRIAIVHCATHNLKALRNALLNSSENEKTSRRFRSRDGDIFTWKLVVEECFIRDRCNQLPATHLDHSSAYPNAWNKMRVGYALRPFSEKTLAEQFCHLSDKLDCIDEMLYKGEIEENKDVPRMHQKRLRVLKEALKKRGKDVSNEVKSQIAGLEYCVYVASIFNERFMNSKCQLTINNIDKIELEIKECLKYFSEWRKATVSLKKDKEHPAWEKYCICQKTYNNLRIQVSGFFYFARRLLHLDKTLEFVPFLYANQSSLESHFSQMRARNADSPQSYIAGLTSIETLKTSKSLKQGSNGMYSGGILDGELQLAKNNFEKASNNTYRHRQHTVKIWLENSKDTRNTFIMRDRPSVMDHAFYQQCNLVSNSKKSAAVFQSITKSFKPIEDIVMNIEIETDFLSYLLEHTNVEDSAVASCLSGSSTESWFKTLFSITDHAVLALVDESCRKVVSTVLHLFRETCLAGSRSRFASLWYNIFESIDNGFMYGHQGPFQNLPSTLKTSRNGLFMLVENITRLLMKWIYQLRRRNCDPGADVVKNEENSGYDQNRKIFAFVGFALSSTIKSYATIERKEETLGNEKKKKEYQNMGTFLRSMRILHKEALLDSTYIQDCYTNLDKMVNRGGMALISTRYFPFAKYLTALCDTFLSEETVCRRGNECLRTGSEEILKSIELKKLWNQCHQEEFKVMLGYSEHNDKIFRKIVKKTMNSRFSFEISKVRAKKFGHYAKSSCNETHRADLKHDFAKTKMKADGQVVEKEIEKRKGSDRLK